MKTGEKVSLDATDISGWLPARGETRFEDISLDGTWTADLSPPRLATQIFEMPKPGDILEVAFAGMLTKVRVLTISPDGDATVERVG